jgi:hypothetical protein
VEEFLASAVNGVAELPAPPSTTYGVRHLEVVLADGRRLEVFHKRYDLAPIPKQVALERGRRECFVYEHVLATHSLGTPALYGSLWDDGNDRHELYLEFVKGRKLSRSLVQERVAAAAWLGRLQASVASDVPELGRSGLLHAYDADYFVGTAERAVNAVGSRFAALVERVRRALAGYDPLVAELCAGERTVVHGSFRNRNVLVAGPDGSPRICPVDWEWTGIGPPLHDLAFLVDGCEPAWVPAVCEAYVAAAGNVPNRMRADLQGLRLHKALRSLARSADWDYPEDVVTKLVMKVESLSSAPR